MSQHDNTEELHGHHSSDSEHHHSSSGHHHHSGSSSKHHSSSGSSHHSDSSSKHHSSSGSSHHSSSGSSHHSSSGSSHHSGSSSKHHGSSGSSHHSSSKHSKSHSSSSKKDYNYYSETSSSEQKEAEEKIKKLGEKFSATEEKENIYFSTGTAAAASAAIVNSSKAKKKKKKKKNKALSIILGIFLFFFSLALIAAVALMIMIATGKKDMLDYSDAEIEVIADAETDDDGKTVKYNGKIYRLNEDITSIACLGVDKDQINQNGVVGAAGQADTIMVIAFNTVTGQATLIPIPRDTVAEIDVYARDGSFLRTEKTQVCLAYAYGDGGKTSCENVISSVKKIIFGLPIHCYAALDLSGIAPINDAVGGVTVVPDDSFANMFVAGQPVHLMGKNAVSFVRSRDTSKVDSNLVRMNHQLKYVKAFTKTAASQAIKNPSMITDIYNLAMKYSFTDIDLSNASYIASRFLTVGTGEFNHVSVPGKMISGEDGYSEYYIDETKFYETILSIYYKEIGAY